MKKIYTLIFLMFIGVACKKKYQPVNTPVPGNSNYNVFQLINTQQSPLPSDSIRDLFTLNSKLFICTANGLALFENNTWQIFNTSNSAIPSNDVNCCYATDSVWWLGTKNGLVKYNPVTQQWKIWNTFNSPLPSNKIRSLCLDKNNVLWIGTFSGGGLAAFDGTSWQVFTPSNSPLPSNSVAKIYCADSIYWIATGNGLARYNGSSWKIYNPGNSGLSSAWVYDIIAANNTDLWIANNNGINLYYTMTDIWQNFNSTNSGLSSNFTRCLYFDATAGKLFIGTDGNGLYLYNINSGQWIHYEFPPFNIPSNYLRDILKFQNQIWIATADKGITMLK